MSTYTKSNGMDLSIRIVFQDLYLAAKRNLGVAWAEVLSDRQNTILILSPTPTSPDH
jgi:hypothetical protein